MSDAEDSASEPVGDVRSLLDALPERVILCERSGRVLFASRTAQALLGRTSGELVDKGVLDVVSPHFHEVEGLPLLEHLLSLAEGESLRGAVVHRRGVEIEVDLAVARLAATDGERILLLMRQMPERNLRASADFEERLQAETYRLVFEGAPVGIFHFDERGVITACNEPFVQIIGSSRRVLVGLNMTTLPFKPIGDAVKRALGGERALFEGVYPSATSDKRTHVRVAFAPIVGPSGDVVGGVGIAEDVTERVHSEQTLRRSFESFRALIEQAPDAIAVHRANQFLLVNPSLVKMLGYASADELLSIPMLEVVHGHDQPSTASRVTDLERGGTGPSREIRLVRKDGSTLLTEVASMPVQFEDGAAILTLARDVTDRKRLEARLAQADRMASIGTLAAGVAHEINNPLTYVLGNLDLLELALSDDAPPRLGGASLSRMVHAARDGCERVRRVVNDLRTHTRADPEIVGPVDLHAVIESALKLAQVEIRHRARVARSLEPVGVLEGNEHRLGQVVLNLLVNAAQAIPPGDPEHHTVRIRTCHEKDWIELSVEDDGVGMPPEVLARLFEPFFTTKPTGVGTGLGLWICLGIVQSHGGSIRVESEAGKGTKFRVLLPARRDAPVSAMTIVGPTKAATRGARILVIDDETQLGVALRSLLSQHEVMLATTGKEGLRLLLEAKAPDLILCDIMMRDVSGLGVYEALRRERPELCDRFVFMTGGVFPEQSIEVLAGARALRLHKPFGRAEVERLLSIVEQRLTR